MGADDCTEMWHEFKGEQVKGEQVLGCLAVVLCQDGTGDLVVFITGNHPENVSNFDASIDFGTLPKSVEASKVRTLPECLIHADSNNIRVQQYKVVGW